LLHRGIIAEPGLQQQGAPLALGVIIPVLNEAENVRPLLAKLEQALGAVAWEAIFVDDDSRDGTGDIVRSLAREDPRVRIIQRVGRRGLSSAVIEGMLASAAPVLAVIDGDLQHDERLLPRLYDAVMAGADIAVASRYTGGGGVGDWSAGRHRASRLATRLAQTLTATPLSDPMSGFFAISRAAFDRALPRLSGGGFKILLDLVASSPHPLAIAELPYRFRARQAGASKLDSRVMLDYALLLIEKTLGRFVPIRLILFLAVGALGVLPNLATLGLLLGCGMRFAAAQTIAVIVAMSCNFALNNALTYRDRRLTGWRFVTGLVSYGLVCSVGAAANVGVGTLMSGAHERWWIAGIAGALVGAMWNFGASSLLTWRK